MAWTGLAAVAAVLLVATGPPARATEKASEAEASDAARNRGEAPAAPDIDLWRVRNIFRYGDEPRAFARPAPVAGHTSVIDPAEAPAPEPRTRLVGLVERGGRRAAALSIDGEVVVLGEGESVGGFTVLDVGDEAVTLRSPEGDEETLPLP
jgi:hypothetical protein